jgi:hypothetical protein
MGNNGCSLLDGGLLPAAQILETSDECKDLRRDGNAVLISEVALDGKC